MEDIIYAYRPSEYAGIRRFCQCPNCLFEWPHYETGRLKEDIKWCEDHYRGPQQCEECGQWSVPTNDRRLHRRGYGRVLCPEPPRTPDREYADEEER